MPRSCPLCGYEFNPDDSTKCSVCGGTLGINESHRESTDSRRLGHEPDNAANALTSPGSPSDHHFSDSNHQSTETIEQSPNGSGGLTGRITHTERYDERPPTDIYQILSKILIGILILIPFLILFFFTGILSFIFAFLGFPSLAQMFNPIIWSTSIFELIEVMVLSRIRGTDTVPIYRGTLIDEEDNPRSFWFRGPIQTGNLIKGNDVCFEGRDRRGTFLVEAGTDFTTNSEITSSYRSPWRIIFFILLVIYGIAGFIIINSL